MKFPIAGLLLLIGAATAPAHAACTPDQVNITGVGCVSGFATGTFGDASHVAQCSFDKQGRARLCTNVAVTGGGGGGDGFDLVAELGQTGTANFDFVAE